MGNCESKNNRNGIAQTFTKKSNHPELYFIKDEKEYVFSCQNNDIMKNVVKIICDQLRINKRHFLFIHNNHPLNENSTYNMLVPNQNNKRIINIDPIDPRQSEMSSRDSREPKLINMETIISKINYPNIIKDDYKNYYIDEGIISDEGYYKIHKAKGRGVFEKFAIKIFDFNSIITDYKSDKMDDPTQKDMEAFVQGLIEQIKNMIILGNNNINSVQLYQCFITKDEFAIVMEYCDTDLRHIFCSQNQFSLPEFVES